MTLEELTAIASAFEVTLPGEYRDAIAVPPFPGSEVHDFELCTDPVVIREENRRVREEGFYQQGWDPSWFVIGIDGSGNDYFIATDPYDGAVYFVDSNSLLGADSLRYNEHFETFAAFLCHLGELHSQRSREQARRAERKWWQFWR